MAKKGLIIMIAPDRNKRAAIGPAGYKDSMGKMGPDDDGDYDNGTGADDAGGDCTVTLPSHVLSDGASEGGINPGDKIDFDCSAEVTDVSDGSVTLSIKTVNGESTGGGGDIEDENEGPEPEDGGGMGGNTRESIADMGKRLRGKAAGIM
jgi:hypothetical protein